MSTEQGGYEAAAGQRSRLTGIGRQVGEIASRIGNEGAAGTVTTLLERLDNDAFHVMVVGDFKRGKSTFVNALLGAQVLPVKATPATAVITEVRYGDTRSAQLWREDAAAPESVDPARLTDLITVNNQARDERNPYVKAEVFWPLELCRHNVVLIDSPGLNEHATRDEITLAHLVKADAVIFLQHAIAPMSISESSFLTSYLDAHDPFFVFTYFDAIDPRDRDDVTHSARRRITDLRGDDRDRDRFHFVDGRSALRAREAGDAEGFRRSGVAELEEALEHYLSTERHKVKLLSPARALRGVTSDLARSVPYELALLDTRTEDLESRWQAAQEPLRALREQARQITSDTRNQTRMLQDRVETLLGGYLATLADRVPVFAAEVQITTKLGMNPIKVKERAEKVAREIAEGIAKRVEEKVAEWVRTSLEPVVHQDLGRIAGQLDGELASFEARLDQLRVQLVDPQDAASIGESQEEAPLQRFLAGVGGFVFGGVAGGMVGARFGAREALRTMPMAVVIALAWLLTPFGLPTLIAATVIHGVWQGGQSGSRLEQRMREAIGREMATRITMEAPTQAREAAQAFADATMEPFATAVSSGLDDRMTELTRAVDSARTAREQGVEAVEQRRSELKQLEDELRRTGESIGDIVDELAMM
ncbi:dynamin family protein [Streptantibioticus rubrisoli]|uniref:Dynamin family protein n=1 Tax=Streptantibioticus rubrisoli TaxID=1387313 RepID=A0ABT1PD87_9ACTN|nr:dynamin family protein [Streptantibioticus rubrisoli]MCQ4043331.1 dynamin family protein [Streptantibioticus rubrisoli]